VGVFGVSSGVGV